VSVEVSIRNEITSVGEDALNSSVIAIRPLRKRISASSDTAGTTWPFELVEQRQIVEAVGHVGVLRAQGL
jgi:hypothetical protein